MVWVNTDSGVYHKPGTRYYGKTKQGKYMTEADAQKAGYRAAGKKLAFSQSVFTANLNSRRNPHEEKNAFPDITYHCRFLGASVAVSHPNASATASAPAAQAASAANPLDINSATKEQLDALPGMGTFQKIIDGRPYAKKTDLVKNKVIPGHI